MKHNSRDVNPSSVDSREMTFAAVCAYIAGMAPIPLHARSVDAVAHRLRVTREIMELNQVEFAGAANIPPNTYNQWEKGVQPPSLAMAQKLCDAHGITLDWIYRGVPDGLPHSLAVKLLTKAS